MTSKDIASFFEKGTTQQFEYCLNLYPKVLKLKADKKGGDKKALELVRLDEWYQNQLPKLIKGRGKDAHMVYDELVQTMKWKQSRGKFYPQLSYLIKVNTPRAVMTETKKAFRKLPNLEQAITALSNLKGVGTTMASALLAAAAPDKAPFMADECLMAIPEIEGIDYTTKEYLNFVQHIQTTVKRLNVEAGCGGENDTALWSPHRVELALWSHYVANDISPELLDEMPEPGAGGGGGGVGVAIAVGIATNGIKPSKVLSGGEDTNDADDDLSLETGRGETNNTATESETDNENTNPSAPLAAVPVGVLQDGDSNFVSNDSTSQEPNIDENTTQTTATTSTDGDMNTPLASDSESNMEAPANTNIANAIASSGVTGAAIVAPLISTITSTANGDNSSSSLMPTAAVINNSATVGNGNGALTTAQAVNNDEISEDDEEDEDDDEDELEDEESNGAVLTPLIANSVASENTDPVLAATVGQKRVLQCGSDGGGIIEECSQPELKKIRSD